MTRCERCLIPDTRPDTAFVDGVCSACIAFDRRKDIDWGARKAELLALLDRHDGRCIVPSSGGKDSHFQVLTLLELGAKPTVVTATTCMLTDIGRRNIDNLARYAPTIEVTPNRTVRAKLNRLGLQLVGDISWPEHAAIFSIPFRVACETNTPLMFYGECPQAHYGSPPGAEEARQLTMRWRSEFGGFLGLRPRDLVGTDGITDRDMEYYSPPDPEWMKSVGVEAHFLGQYVAWDSHGNAKAARSAGMTCAMPGAANWWPFENLDCAMTGLHCHAMYRKYGYGRAAAQLSVDIRCGLAQRYEALDTARIYDGLFPHAYMGIPFPTVCDHIGMSEDEVMKTLNQFTDWSLFDGEVDGRPILKEFA